MSQVSSPRRNVSKACKACRERKVRCGGQQPTCGRCSTHLLTCDYSSRLDRRSRGARLSVSVREEARTPTAEYQDAVAYASGSASAVNGREWRAQEDTGISSAYQASDSLQYDISTGSLIFLGPTSIPQGSTDLPSLVGERQSWIPGPSLPSSSLGVELGQSLHDELLDQYFTFLNGFCAFVDEAAFREGWASSSAGSGQECIGYSPFLHLAILACAAHISNRTDLEPFNGDGNQSSPGSKDLTFTSRAVDMLDKEIEHPRPTSIQGLTLLIMVVADCGKNSFAWVYCGIASQLSEALGLHIDARGLQQCNVISEVALKTREHAYWSLYVQDKLIALYLGRRSHVDETDADILLPVTTITMTGSPCLEEYEQALVTLCTIWSREHRYLYGIRHRRSGRLTRSEGDLKRELRDWKANLPPALSSPESRRSVAPNVLVIHALHNTFTILLHRIHLHSRCLESADGIICLEAALSTMRLARTYDITYGISKAPVTMTQNMFVASSVLTLIVADQYDQPIHIENIFKARNALDELDTFLDRLSSSWALTGHALSRLRALRSAGVVDTSALGLSESGFDFTGLDELFSFSDFQ